MHIFWDGVGRDSKQEDFVRHVWLHILCTIIYACSLDKVHSEGSDRTKKEIQDQMTVFNLLHIHTVYNKNAMGLLNLWIIRD